jgi:hypothetical protein
MKRLRSLWGRFTGWWAKNKKLLLVVLLIVVPVVMVLYLLVEAGYAYSWTGFGEYNPSGKPDTGYQRAKTTWDWLDLLIIPIVLAVGGFFLNRTERMNAERAAEQRATVERELAEQRAQDTALETYIDRMAELLLDKQLLNSKPDDEVRNVARIRTLTAFRRFDGKHNKILILFLRYSGLLGGRDKSPILDMSKADLRGTNLQGVNLHEAVLHGGKLHEANLQGADLTGADLTGADLTGADLTGADLTGADLKAGEDLQGNKLPKANLDGANLKDATMPDGRKYEDWLKDNSE